MELEEQLEVIRDLIADGKAKTALKQLKPFYDPVNPDLQVMLEIVSAMFELEQWGKARAMLGKAIEHYPDEHDLWVELSSLYQVEDDFDKALEAINIGLQRHPNEQSLIVEKARLFGETQRQSEMHDLIESTIAQFPNSKASLLTERALIYQQLSYNPESGVDIVKNGLGMEFAVKPLKMAVEDLDRALEASDQDWHIYMKRAKLKKDLQEFDSAIEDFDAVLELLGEEDEPVREFIEQERDGCLNGGLNERSQIADLIKQGMDQVDEVGELSQEQMITNNIIEAMADGVAQGEDVFELIEDMDDDPDQLIALDIAQELLKQAREPSADFVRADPAEFARSARLYCARVARAMGEYQFKSMGDFEPRGLVQHLGSRFLVRIFVSSEKTAVAAAFEVKPLKPKLLTWLLMLVLGKWKAARVTELVTETVDGQYIITNNSGDANPFTLEGNVDFITLPAKTSIEETIASHLDRIGQYAREQLVTIDNIDQLFEQQERLRVVKNAYREKIGFVTDDELKKLLGKQYDKYAKDVRKYLKKLTRKMD